MTTDAAKPGTDDIRPGPAPRLGEAAPNVGYERSMTSRVWITTLALLVGAHHSIAADCLAACKRAEAACLERAAKAVTECRDAMEQHCAAACDCEATVGATRIACLQRCQVCRDMFREGGGGDCDALDDDRRADCADERARCERRCRE
jgi:hypothetical protein